MSDVDGYIEFTITGRYPIVLAGYAYDDGEGNEVIAHTLDDAERVDTQGVEQGTLTPYDLVDFADHEVDIVLKAVPSE